LSTTINSTQLSVADKKITVGKGSGSSSAANESGFEVGVGADGASSNPSMLYSSSGTKFVINKPLDITGNVTATRAVLTDGITDTGQAGSSTVFNESGSTADFRIESTGNDNMFVVDGGLNRVGIGTYSQAPRILLDIQGSVMPATGDAASVEDMLTLYRNGSASVWSGGATLALGRYSTGNGSAPKSRLDFKLKNAAGSNTALPETTVMTLQSNGNVGIGTATPGAPLAIISNNASQPSNYATVWAKNSDTTGAAYAGYVADGHLQSHYRYYIQGALKWQTRVGAGAGTDTFSIYSWTKGADVLNILNTGNVGIGTSSPTEKLHIFNSLQSWNQFANIRMSTENDSYAAEIGFHRGTSNDNDRGLFLSGDGTNQQVKILHGGNVGIGTTAPFSKLSINSNGAPATSTGNMATTGLTIHNGTGGTGVQLGTYDAGSWGYIQSGYVNNATVAREFRIMNGANYTMTLSNTGNVGIGNTDPQVSLALGNASGERLHVYHGGNVRAGFGVDMSGSSRELSIFHSTTGTNGNISFGERLESNGAYTENMRIQGDGNVGIGTTAPVQKLHIAGAKTYVSNIVQGQLQVEDTTSAAAGVGGGILFTGSYTGSTTTSAASIEAAKSNGTGGNYSFDMVFKTRDNGGGNVERARFGADGGDPSYGRLRLTSSWGAFELGAANNAYFHFQRNTGPTVFYFSHPAQASGGFSTYSDERLKEEITTITGALDKVAVMNGITFKWKDAAKRGGGDTGKQFGVLAQNMLTVDSELPKLNVDPLETQENIDDASKDTDYYSMDYARITPFLIEAVKELKTKIETLQREVQELKDNG